MLSTASYVFKQLPAMLLPAPLLQAKLQWMPLRFIVSYLGVESLYMLNTDRFWQIPLHKGFIYLLHYKNMSACFSKPLAVQ